MPAGSLRIQVADLVGAPVNTPLYVSFSPAANSPGGAAMEVHFPASTDTEFVVEGILCRAGPGTLYRVQMEAENFRPFSFFQLMTADRANQAPESMFLLAANPNRVRDIKSPAFAELDPAVRSFLTAANMQALEGADRDLLGLSGDNLYAALSPTRKACLLNISKKARHASSDGCFRLIEGLLVSRNDRLYCGANAEMPAFLRQSALFESANPSLHTPLAGYQLAESFKSKDAHANLQVTLMRHPRTGALAADVDIDEAAGIRHGFEVIRNSVKRGKTNPYQVRELLLLSELAEKTLDPGYRFIFR